LEVDHVPNLTRPLEALIGGVAQAIFYQQETLVDMDDVWGGGMKDNVSNMFDRWSRISSTCGDNVSGTPLHS